MVDIGGLMKVPRCGGGVVRWPQTMTRAEKRQCLGALLARNPKGNVIWSLPVC